MMTSPKFRVAICGGGIGGLALALGLAEYDDIAIDIYEAAAQFKEIGAGIGIWGRGISAFRKWNLEQKARKIASSAPGEGGSNFEAIRADKPSGELMGYVAMSATLGFHRSQLIDLLAEELTKNKRATTHFGKRFLSFIQEEGQDSDAYSRDSVTLKFLDGTSATCDVLVGCDGIKSAVRGELLYGSTTVPSVETSDMTGERRRFIGTRFSGTVAYRALVNPEHLRAIDPKHSAILDRKMYCGKNRHIVSYPVAQGKFINFAALCSDPKKKEEWENNPWVVEANQDELINLFTDFEPEVQKLFKCIAQTSRWAMYDIEPLTTWSKGRVTLLGDAAHATTPFLGAGGGQVLEDAYVLSRLLGSQLAVKDTLPFVLSAYERVRMPRANKVIDSSREALRCYQFLEEYEDISNDQMIKSLAKLTGWLVEDGGGLEDDVQEAERLLQAMV